MIDRIRQIADRVRSNSIVDLSRPLPTAPKWAIQELCAKNRHKVTIVRRDHDLLGQLVDKAQGQPVDKLGTTVVVALSTFCQERDTRVYPQPGAAFDCGFAVVIHRLGRARQIAL